MKFEIFPEINRGLAAISPEYFVRLRADNHEAIAITGDGYTSKASAMHAAKLLQATNWFTPVYNVGAAASPHHGERFEIRQSVAGLLSTEYRWRYFAGNGELIAHSGEGYKDVADCRHAINLIMSTSMSTPIVEAGGLLYHLMS